MYARRFSRASCLVSVVGVFAMTLGCRDAARSCPAGMAPLSAGTFARSPERTVTVQPACMDTVPVTADAYAECVRTGRCGTDKLREYAADPLCNYGVAGRGNHPMNCVEWTQAARYCEAQAERLPTEDEYEWAARGQARGTTYPWGNDEPTTEVCWKELSTCAVGSHPTGDAPGGIHDLAGNVWEWTASRSGDSRVYRGGSWGSNDSKYLRAASWSKNVPTVGYNILGFRCVR